MKYSLFVYVGIISTILRLGQVISSQIRKILVEPGDDQKSQITEHFTVAMAFQIIAFLGNQYILQVL